MEKMTEEVIKYGTITSPKEEKVEEKSKPKVAASFSITETETDAEELSELKLEIE
tara:strand:- start:1511 stop:1675 length:165 start_codon:yes stop_codon:yes gene_type:complete